MKKMVALLLSLALLFSIASVIAEEAAEPVNPPKVAAILYTTRAQQAEIADAKIASGMDEAQATKEACFEVMESMAEMGYQGVQFWTVNFSIPAAELKAKADELGLEIIAPHFHNMFSWTEEDWENNLAYLAELSCDSVVYPYDAPAGYDGTRPVTQKELEDWAAALGDGLEKSMHMIKSLGYDMQLIYHSHWNELITIDSLGVTLLDALYERFDGELSIQLDVAWASWPRTSLEVFGYTPFGNEGFEKYWMKRWNQYTETLHIKDVDFETSIPRAIGQGDIEWNALLPLFAKAGVDWFIVEDDFPEQGNRTGTEDLKVSIDYLKAMYQTLGWAWGE